MAAHFAARQTSRSDIPRPGPVRQQFGA